MQQLLLSSAELLVILSLLTIARETRGKHWCKTEGVGRMRAIIGEPLPDANEPTDPRVAEYARDQRRAASMLARHCRECGKCRLGRSTVTAPPLRLATNRGEAGSA